MKSQIWCLLGAIFALIATVPPVQAAYTLKDGWFVNSAEVATTSPEGHFAAAAEAFNEGKWNDAAFEFNIIAANFPLTVYGQEAYYYMGVAYYNLDEYDFANEAFTQYLKAQSNPRFFQETIAYKYTMAEKLATGARCRFFGTKHLPKWASGQGLALTIYDEVIAAMPCHEMAAYALLSKGWLQWQMRDYRSAVESFQLVIRRFPKHELAPECYLYIAKVYLEQCWYEFQNPDILAFAEINMRRFQRDFPREERLCQVQEDLLAIKEIYARGLYQTGQFYERTRRPRAAIIYYRNTIHQFPDTCIADLCRKRLLCIDPSYSIPQEGEKNVGELEGAMPSDSVPEESSVE